MSAPIFGKLMLVKIEPTSKEQDEADRDLAVWTLARSLFEQRMKAQR